MGRFVTRYWPQLVPRLLESSRSSQAHAQCSEWDVSCQSVLGALPLVSSSREKQLARQSLSSCSGRVALFCSGSGKEWKTERLFEAGRGEQVGFVSLQVASWFAAVVMERYNGKLTVALRLAFVNEFEIMGGTFTVGSVTDLVRRQVRSSIWMF